MRSANESPEWSHAGPAAARECLAACVMTDAERYTSVTESMAPSAIVQMINEYFAALFRPVLNHGGMIADVKGDGVLALWNHESAGSDLKAKVCTASLEIVHAVELLNRAQPARRLPTRLGIDFGPVAIAHVGAHERFECRAVGDPVNTSSRLEALNKVLKTRILVSDAFAEGVSGFLFRDLGSFQLRGKRSRTRVKELVGALEHCSLREHALCREFTNAVASLEFGTEAEALARFQALQAKHPEDGPVRYFLQRLDAAVREPEQPPLRSWISQLWRVAR